jgi:hypothetical protein
MYRVLSRLPLGMSALRYADPTSPTITNLPSASAICAIVNIDAIFAVSVALGSVVAPKLNRTVGFRIRVDFSRGSIGTLGLCVRTFVGSGSCA